MKHFFLFLKRFLRSPAAVLSMAAIALVAGWSFGYVQVKQDLPCALYAQEDTPAARDILHYLAPQGFTLCPSQAMAEELVRTGKADCGIILLEGLEAKMAQGNLKDCAQLLVSPRTCRENTFAMIAAVALFREYVPHLAASTSTSLGYEADPKTIAAYMQDNYGVMPQLAFEITSVDGTVLEEQPSTNLPLGLLALCGFVVMGFLAIGVVEPAARQVRSRLSRRRLFFAGILSQTMALALLLGLAACIGTAVGSLFWDISLKQLLPGLVGYYLWLGWLCGFFVLLPLNTHMRCCLVALIAAVSLFLCPVYWDIALYVPALLPLRVVAVPYALYQMVQTPAVTFLLAAASVMVLLGTRIYAGKRA